MLNSKQRAQLRAMANSLDSIIHVGKTGLTDNITVQLDGVLATRELIKGTVLETSPLTAKEAANALAEKTKADVVQVIGRRFVLYRRNNEKPTIELCE
ncbi:MAG: YhbY family RNA-binding protein [Oscillospiraceae bacterium]|nr:YhbY family RNA-binding protein [Oscillospiraceae bacterium]